MKYVLVKIKDDSVESFVAKAGSRVVGVWDLPDKNDYCRCTHKTVHDVSNWPRDPKTGQRVCKVCRKPGKTWFEGIMDRLKFALGNNMIDKIRRG